jgi:hypothetical protein
MCTTTFASLGWIVGKKKRQLKHLEQGHKEHHAELEEMREYMEQNRAYDQHVMPTGQPHMPKAYCYCMPKVEYEHPLTGKKLYVHHMRIH